MTDEPKFLNDSKDTMKDQGLRMVSGMPAMTPVLRPLTHSLWDSEWCDPEYPDERHCLFQDHKSFMHGGHKSVIDTNMRASGHLGTPLEYDIYGLAIQVQMGVSEEDYISIIDPALFIWFFGSCTTWLEQPAATFAEPWEWWKVRPIEEDPKKGIKFDEMKAYFFALVVGSDTGKPRRITSRESFRGELRWKKGVRVKKKTKYTVHAIGTLYGQL